MVKKLALIAGVSAFYIVEAFSLAFGLWTRSFWISVAAFGTIVLGSYLFYIRFHVKREKRYPMVPPGAKSDIYFPRTNIPRPVHADVRKIEEEKREKARLDDLMKKKVSKSGRR